MDPQKIAVSGESKILRLLLDYCLKASPWLSLSDESLTIDWDLLFQHQKNETKPNEISSELLKAVKTFLPEWPLFLTRELSETSWQGSPHHSLEKLYFTEFFPLSESIRGAFDSIRAPLMKLSVQLKKLIVPRNRHYALGAIPLEAESSVGEVCRLAEIAFLEKKLGVRYLIGERLVCATANMAALVKGPQGNYYGSQAKAKEGRAESMRLARRLIRAHLDLYQQLEVHVDSIASMDRIFPTGSSLMKAIESLAHIEKSLAYSLLKDQEMNGRRLRKIGFVELDTEFNYLDADRKIHSFNRGARQPGFWEMFEEHETIPFGPVKQRLTTASKALHDLGDLLPYQNVEVAESIRAEINVSRMALMEASKDLRVEAKQSSSLATEINEAIDWLIAKSPLLSLLASGAVQFFEQESREKLPCFGLSPWLTASVMARKYLGTLPLTYMGLDPSQEAKDEEAETDQKKERDKLHEDKITGRRIWELAQSSLA